VADDQQLVPAPRENLVALRDRREAVIAALTDNFAKDVIDLDEFDRRIDLAHGARSLAELDDLVTDLAPLPATALATQPSEVALDRFPEKRRWLCIMSGVDKSGRWTVPRKMSVVCFWGGAELDLREADIAPGVTELHVICIMGGCHLIVPPSLAVEIDGTAIMGGFDERHRGHGEPDPGRSVARDGALRDGRLLRRDPASRREQPASPQADQERAQGAGRWRTPAASRLQVTGAA
jgi:hypothetical protein